MLRKVCAIALIAVSVSACCSSRSVVKESSDRVATYEQRDSVKEEVMVAVHDTIMETTTITYVLRQAQEPNEPEDTVKVTTVTERDRIRNRDAIAMQKTKTETVRDTVIIERRDSVDVKETLRQAQGDRARASPVVSALKWVFWIIIALAGFVIVIKMFNILK